MNAMATSGSGSSTTTQGISPWCFCARGSDVGVSSRQDFPRRAPGRWVAMTLIAIACFATGDAHAQWYAGVALGGNASRGRGPWRAGATTAPASAMSTSTPRGSGGARLHCAGSRGGGRMARAVRSGRGIFRRGGVGIPACRRDSASPPSTPARQRTSTRPCRPLDAHRRGLRQDRQRTLGRRGDPSGIRPLTRSRSSSIATGRTEPGGRRTRASGVAASRTRKDFSWLWARSADPADIATRPGPAERGVRSAATSPALSARAAATLATPSSDTFWSRASTASCRNASQSGSRPGGSVSRHSSPDAYEGDLLRSHPPNLRLDGSEPVSAWSRTGDTGRFSALLTVRYAMP